MYQNEIRTRVSRSNKISRAAMEALEDRRLFAAAPSVPFGSTIDLKAMRSQTLTASITSAAQVQSWSVNLAKGDYLSADVDSLVKSDLKLTVRGPDGKVIKANDDAVDPETNKWSLDPFLIASAPMTGKYTVSVQDSAKSRRTVAEENYTLALQKYAVSSDPASADPQGNMDAVLKPQGRWAWVTGNTLIMTDAMGNGFGMTGNWKQNVNHDANGMTSSVYTADKLYIDVKIPGEISKDAHGNPQVGPSHTDRIAIKGSMTVATTPSPYGYTVSQVDWTQFGAPPVPGNEDGRGGFRPSGSGSNSKTASLASLASLTSVPPASLDAQPLLADFSAKYGLNASAPSVGFGMGRGSDLGFLGAPLRPDGTYFYITASNSYSASFGNVSASAGSGLFTLVIDPGDPFVYVKVADLIEFGGSLKGMIPFVPQASNYDGPGFMGHLYSGVQGVQLGELPINLDGNLTLNIDANNDGVPYGLNGDASKFFKPGGLALSALNDVKVGANAGVNFGYDIKGVNISVPLGRASFGYTPPHLTNTLLETYTTGNFSLTFRYPLADNLPANYTVPPSRRFLDTVISYGLERTATPGSIQVAGSSIDPLGGTPLAGVFQGNQFAFKAGASGNTTAQLLSSLTASMQLTQGNGINLGGFLLGSSQTLGVTLSRQEIGLNGQYRILSGVVTLGGTIDPSNGNFAVTGSASASANLPFLPANSRIASASASFLLARNYRMPNGQYFSGFRANLNLNFDFTATVKIPVFGSVTAGARGSVYGYVDFQTNGTFYGSLSATGTVVVPFISDPSISVGASFDNNGINLDLPLVPDLRINFR